MLCKPYLCTASIKERKVLSDTREKKRVTIALKQKGRLYILSLLQSLFQLNRFCIPVAIGKRLADEAATKNRNRLFQIAHTYLLTHSPTYRSSQLLSTSSPGETLNLDSLANQSLFVLCKTFPSSLPASPFTIACNTNYANPFLFITVYSRLIQNSIFLGLNLYRRSFRPGQPARSGARKITGVTPLM